MKNEKGITLVALILIIVVLLILAGISIMLVINNETEEKPANNSLNQIVYDANLFENAYNEYQNSVEDDKYNKNTIDTNEPVENELNVNDINSNTVSNNTELQLTNNVVANETSENV